MDNTGMFVNDNGRLVEKQVPIEDVIFKYKENSSNVYPIKFFKNMVKLRGWQNEVGQKIAEKFDISSAIDFGCAQGYYLEGLHSKGVKIKGFEHAYQNAKQFIPLEIEDYIFGKDIQIPEINHDHFDFAMSIEVAEHLLAENSLVYIENICRCNPEFILFSAAGPNQNGLGHINARPLSDWIEYYSKFGYSLSDQLTEDFRNIFRSLKIKSKYNRMLSKHVVGFSK